MIEEIDRLVKHKLENSQHLIIERLLATKEYLKYQSGLKTLRYSSSNSNKKIVIGTLDEINPKNNMWKYATYALAIWNYRPVLCDVDLLEAMDLTQVFEIQRHKTYISYYEPVVKHNMSLLQEDFDYVIRTIDKVYYEEGYSIAHHDISSIQSLHRILNHVVIMEDHD